jgi:hypothetical protein
VRGMAIVFASERHKDHGLGCPQLWGSRAFTEPSIRVQRSFHRRNPGRLIEFKVPQSWGI